MFLHKTAALQVKKKQDLKLLNQNQFSHFLSP